MEEITKSKDLTIADVNLDSLIATFGGLTPEQIEQIKAVDLLEMQSHMENTIHANDTVAKTPHQLSLDFVYAKSCLDSEAAEVMALLPWKNWKAKQYSLVTPEQWSDSIAKDGAKIFFEMIDMTFFFSVMQLKIFEYLGINGSESFMKYLYIIKYLENLKRVEAGTFDKGTYSNAEMDEKLKNIKELFSCINSRLNVK